MKVLKIRDSKQGVIFEGDISQFSKKDLENLGHLMKAHSYAHQFDERRKNRQ